MVLLIRYLPLEIDQCYASFYKKTSEHLSRGVNDSYYEKLAFELIDK